MQTFVPYRNLIQSASVLDKKRLFKQVVEAKQILCSLNANNLPKDWRETKTYINKSFSNHPAVKMWKGYEECLKYYYNIFLDESLNRGIKTTMPFIDGKYSKSIEGWREYALLCDESEIEFPWWFENEDLFRTHRARLIEKDELFYGAKFVGDKGFNNGMYLWAVMESKTYKII